MISTIPWDSYLIRTGIWTYPRHAVLGPTIWSIPIEELFFFIIQTYGVSLLYLLLSKPTFHPAYLPHPKIRNPNDSFVVRNSRVFGTIGQMALSFGLWQAWKHVQRGGTGMYMGLIVVWAFPFLLLLWSVARLRVGWTNAHVSRSLTHNFVLRLPKSDIIYPIIFPTLYLWVVDTLALKRGTWVIVEGTKLGVHLWDGLEIEYDSWQSHRLTCEKLMTVLERLSSSFAQIVSSLSDSSPAITAWLSSRHSLARPQTHLYRLRGPL